MFVRPLATERRRASRVTHDESFCGVVIGWPRGTSVEGVKAFDVDEVEG